MVIVLPRCVYLSGDPWGNLEGFFVTCAAELSGNPAHIIRIVKGANALPAPAAFFLVHVGAIIFLNAGRVFEHDRGEVGGGVGQVNLAREPMLGQDRQCAGMVDVSVGQQHGSDGLRIESKAPIMVLGLLPATLKHPAIHQDITSGNLSEMAAPSNRPCSAVKRQLHGFECIP
jgi:hypothetical protein